MFDLILVVDEFIASLFRRLRNFAKSDKERQYDSMLRKNVISDFARHTSGRAPFNNRLWQQQGS
jgi:hypothetical protein